MNIDRIHLEPQCATDNSQARTYCMKDNNYKEYGRNLSVSPLLVK